MGHRPPGSAGQQGPPFSRAIPHINIGSAGWGSRYKMLVLTQLRGRYWWFSPALSRGHICPPHATRAVILDCRHHGSRPTAAWCAEAFDDAECTGDPIDSFCGTGDECGPLSAAHYRVACATPGDAASEWEAKAYLENDCIGTAVTTWDLAPGACRRGLKVDCSKGPPSGGSSKLSTGAIVGITAGSLLLVAICALGFYKAAPRSGAGELLVQ